MRPSPTLDTAIVGSGIAGLSAALTLVRVCRNVAVFGSGSHRNAVAAHSHNFITRDGTPPDQLLASARADVERYGVEVEEEWVERIERDGENFVLALRSGRTVTAHTVILATGVRDVLPSIPGLAEAWGRNVVHCPYCHGYELRGRTTVVLGHTEDDIHKAGLLAGLTRTITLCTGGPDVLGADALALLSERGVAVDERPVARIRLEGEAAAAIEFEDGEERPCGAVYITPEVRLNNDLAHSLGVAVEHKNHLVNSDKGRTGVPGVYVAGDGSGSSHQLIAAAASGFDAACAANSDLVERGATFGKG